MNNRELAITKAQMVIAAWDDCVAAEKTPGTRAVVDFRAEELIDHLLSSFDADMSKLGKGATIADTFTGTRAWLSATALDDIPDQLVPIAVIRELLWKHKIMFNPTNVDNWGAFVQRFGRYILAA